MIGFNIEKSSKLLKIIEEVPRNRSVLLGRFEHSRNFLFKMLRPMSRLESASD